MNPNFQMFHIIINSAIPNRLVQHIANTSVTMVLSYYGWTDTPDVLTDYYGVSTTQSPSGLASVFIQKQPTLIYHNDCFTTNGSISNPQADWTLEILLLFMDISPMQDMMVVHRI